MSGQTDKRGTQAENARRGAKFARPLRRRGMSDGGVPYTEERSAFKLVVGGWHPES